MTERIELSPRHGVLIVRHGPGRGRIPGYLDAAFASLRKERPGLWDSLVFHETGREGPSLDGIGAVVFFLGDPLRERYAQCYEEARALALQGEKLGLRILNPPDALSNSVKSVQSRLWRAAGILTPEVSRFESLDELRDISAGFSYPVLLGADELQGPRRLQICPTRREVLLISELDVPLPGSAATLVDVRQSFRQSRRRSIWSRFHHKKRILVLGDRTRTKHLFFSRQPIVSAKSCVFRDYIGRRYGTEWFVRLDPWASACIRADLAYWRSPTVEHELMKRAVRTLGLDFAALDYSELGDGRTILWEANPYPSIPTVKEIMVPKRRLAGERVASYERSIADFLQALSNA